MTPRHLLPAAAICLLALAGCGNKGPLVRPSDVPPAQPPVTDAVAPPPAQGD
jgi:predicted small lipoprotein YifL